MWPTFSVPGMRASSTTRPSLYIDDVVANDPIPSVSKKSVTAPMTSCTGVGQPSHFARACRNQKTQNATVTAASTTNKAAFALIALDSYPGTRGAGRNSRLSRCRRGR